MGEKMKQFLQKQSDKEADDILAQINADPEMADVHAPEEMEEALFARIDAYEKENAHRNLSEEDKELIELGKAYKKHRKRRKFTAVASLVLVGVMVSGITAMGGPEKVVEVVRRMVEERDHTVVNADNERVESVKEVTEWKAFGEIEKEFGFTPVKMYYVPEGVDFQECLINREVQYINMLYQSKDDRIIICVIRPNYKVSSTGSDVEDILINEYKKTVDEREIVIKQYMVEENGEDRWIAEFQEGTVYYFLQMYNLDKVEVDKITDKLYFHN